MVKLLRLASGRCYDIDLMPDWVAAHLECDQCLLWLMSMYCVIYCYMPCIPTIVTINSYWIELNWIVIGWPVISTILLLETSNLKCRYMRSPSLRFGAWNVTRGQRSRSGVTRHFTTLEFLIIAALRLIFLTQNGQISSLSLITKFLLMK